MHLWCVCSEQLCAPCLLLQGSRGGFQSLFTHSCHLQLVLGPPTTMVPFNIGSEIQTHPLSPHKSSHRLIKTSRQPEAARNHGGLRAAEQSRPPASQPLLRLELAFQSDAEQLERRAHLAGGHVKCPPDFGTRSGWKRASRKGGSGGPRCKRLHPTQACSRQQEPPQQRGGSRALLSTAPTPRERRRLQREDALLQQPLPNVPSQQAGWKSVCPSLPTSPSEDPAFAQPGQLMLE